MINSLVAEDAERILNLVISGRNFFFKQSHYKNLCIFLTKYNIFFGNLFIFAKYINKNCLIEIILCGAKLYLCDISHVLILKVIYQF